MDKPVIAATKPKKVQLVEGEEYYWCACGRSANQPFCDGSHRITSITPVAFTADKTGDAFLCLCKQTKNPPYCDGTHQQVKRELNESETAITDPPVEPNQPVAKTTVEEPYIELVHALAKQGLEKIGHHGPMDAMGVPLPTLPRWDDIQIITAQMASKPLMDDTPVGTDVIIGKNAKKPLTLQIPLLVSDMSFGALSEEAKIALAQGAELSGTGICSGEGGMLPEEQANNSRYFYELASAKFGYDESLLEKVQAFHFKGGQSAKTGTGGHLPGRKVTEKIAAVRHIKPGTDAISPATFPDLITTRDFIRMADRIREITGGIPIGFKLSAQHIEEDIEFAAKAGADYIILDGRGGGTGAAPTIFRDHISVPTIPALARARRYLDHRGYNHISLIITGGLRTPADFVKALCLGADAIALATAALQAIGCVGARMCHTNNCPTGITTQNPELRARLKVETASQNLARFFNSSIELMKLLARACGHHHMHQFSINDLTTWKKSMNNLTGIPYAGITPL